MRYLTLALAAVLALRVTDAVACEEAVDLDRRPDPTPVQIVAEAEKVLEDGRPAIAASRIMERFPNIRSTSAQTTNPVATRAVRVFALALVRMDGKLEKGMIEPWPTNASGPPPTWTQRANLEWAAESLREIDEKRPNDPAVQADLGEALSKLPHGRAKAHEMLTRLAKKDLMGSPHAYAALAKMESESGDRQSAELALKRCREMTKSPRICAPHA